MSDDQDAPSPPQQPPAEDAGPGDSRQAGSAQPPPPPPPPQAPGAPMGAVGSPTGWANCPRCGAAWPFGANSCQVCRQVDGLPTGIHLSSPGKRLGEFLLDVLLIYVTLVIGWLIWLLIVMKDGQTPAKQLLSMRAVNLATHRKATWGTTALREVVRLAVAIVAGFTLIGWVLYFWLLWNRDYQELWDLAADTVVVDDPDGVILAT